MDGYTGIQRVFLGWGQVWLDKTREEALRNQVASPILIHLLNLELMVWLETSQNSTKHST